MYGEMPETQIEERLNVSKNNCYVYCKKIIFQNKNNNVHFIYIILVWKNSKKNKNSKK